ncbi:unnamed protein product [Gongylonema pulchrum]|uniref:Ald_Xan_dh_C domain-containing protein n=1 Tax=Gongylonema pulchrum TaxID=637853 RepID=A0A183CYC8_9BILA|nr:unnamed protein product [Gongylonema pulchrum]
MVMVLAPIARGVVEDVEISAAMKLPGVVAYIDHKDVRPGAALGHAQDTPIFANGEISYHGQPVGAVIAQDHETARRAAHCVKIHCTPQKPIVTIEDAIASSSYFAEKPMAMHSFMSGCLDQPAAPDWSTMKNIVKGSVKIGGQEHFYMETNSFIVIPGETDELEVIASTQSVTDVQESVAQALGLAQHKVTVRTKRIGGGFGGKESSSCLFVVPAAIAAVKLHRPVKITMERFDDMAMSGTRHPFRCDYKCGIDNDGKLRKLEMMFYSNAGHSLDLSIGVMHRAITHCDNCYKFPYADVYGRLCKTNLASNTAFRGFGAPQAMFACETMMYHAAKQIGLDVNEVHICIHLFPCF